MTPEDKKTWKRVVKEARKLSGALFDGKRSIEEFGRFASFSEDRPSCVFGHVLDNAKVPGIGTDKLNFFRHFFHRADPVSVWWATGDVQFANDTLRDPAAIAVALDVFADEVDAYVKGGAR